MIWAKSWRNRHRFFQAQTEQRRTRKQNESKGDLHDDESVAKPLRGATNRAGARFRLERMRQMSAQIEPRDRHRDPDSEKYSARETNQREPAIERNVGAERQAICPENFEQSNSPRAYRQAEQSADESQKNGFDDYLSHDMHATRAHRSADRHFFRPPARTNQKKIHQIYRADEQKKKYYGLHQQKGRKTGADVLCVQWPNE